MDISQNKRRAWRKTWIATCALMVGFMAAHLQLTEANPVTGKREIVLVTQQDEVNIGNDVFASYQLESGGLYLDNPEVNAYVSRVGKKIAAESDRPDLPFEFVVIKNDTPNAWALPGGKIAINTGMLVLLDNEAELAAVLAHEIAHATARHTAQRIEREMLMEGVAYIDVAINPIAIVNASVDPNRDFKNMKYSRDNEREADAYGMEYMARAGYDVSAAKIIHHKLNIFYNDPGHRDGVVDSLYETHPRDEERIANCRKLEEQYALDGFQGREEFMLVFEAMKSQYVLPKWD